MKKIIKNLIYLVFFFTACNTDTYDYYQAYENINMAKNYINYEIAKDIDYVNKEAKSSPTLKEYFNEFEIINIHIDSINTIISKVKTIMLTESFTKEGDIQKLDSFNYTIDVPTLRKLKKEIYSFSIFCDSIVEDSLIHGIINEKLDYSDWPKIKFLNGQEANMLEAFTVLTKLEFDISVAQKQLYDYYLNNVSIEKQKFTKVEAVAILNKQNYKVGDTLNAKFFLLAYDTTNYRDIIVDGKLLEKDSTGKSIYKFNIPVGYKGHIIKYLKAQVINPANGRKMKIPFTLDYFVN